MDKTQQALSQIVVYNKYAKYLVDKQRRETWEEIVYRYLNMLAAKYPHLADEIWTNGSYLLDKKVLMSMRGAQFAGKATDKNNTRIYNCAYLPIDHSAAFSETMFLLLSGTGVGYSVQYSHVEKLPDIRKPTKEQKFLIGDSIEGWADAVRALMYSYFGKRSTKPRFDYSDIRRKGERLVTAGGKAPGPEPLKRCLTEIELILERKRDGEKLNPIEVHDIICHIAHAVLAGGIRRAALICLFSADDNEMVTAKSGSWWELNPQRGRANNSAVLLRHRVTKEFFLSLWKKIEISQAGEPGVYFTNDKDWGTNPCCEVALRAYQFCNLTEINAGGLFMERVKQGTQPDTAVTAPAPTETQPPSEQEKAQAELNKRAKIAAFFGTLQAGFTDFHYLRPVWKTTTEKDALIGVGITGICNGDIFSLDLREAEQIIDNENKRIAALIGINEAARKTTIKPSGSTSCVLGTSSGIHAWHAKYYIRNMQCAVGDDLYNYFSANHPELIKIMDRDPNSAVIGIPQKAPKYALLREDENAIQMLERVFKFYDNWVKPGSKSGANTNNVSATVYIDVNKTYLKGENTWIQNNSSTDEYLTENNYHGWNEWEAVGEMLWDNRHKFNGMSVLPYDGGSYKDAPFIEITEEEFNNKLQYLKNIDLTKIVESDDNTNLADQVACAGGACEVQ